MMMAALSTYHAGITQIVFAGEEFADVLRRRYLPFAITIPIVDAEGVRRSGLTKLLPWTEPMATRPNQSVAYVCRNFTCEAPVTAPRELEAKL
jgi:uncharacterized protein YyaL (SSP411 family)